MPDRAQNAITMVSLSNDLVDLVDFVNVVDVAVWHYFLTKTYIENFKILGIELI